MDWLVEQQVFLFGAKFKQKKNFKKIISDIKRTKIEKDNLVKFDVCSGKQKV